MSLYRQTGELRRRRRMLIGAAVGLVVVVGAVVALVAGGGGESAADRRAEARQAAQTAADGLELLGIEYGQAVRNGRVVAPTEYTAANADVARARKALSDHRAAFPAAQVGALRAAEDDLAQLAMLVRRKVAAAQLRDAQQAAARSLTELAR